jgi:hypothetical protein
MGVDLMSTPPAGRGAAAAGVLLSLMVCAAAVACDRAKPTPTSAPSTAVTATTASAPKAYRAVENLCTAIDWAPLLEVYQSQAPNPTYVTAGDSGLTSLRCSSSLKVANDPLSGMLINFDFEVWAKPEGAQRSYDQRKQYATATTSLPGLGTEAFTDVDPQLGQQISVRDGNLMLTVSWGPLFDTKLPDLTDRVTRVIQAAMTALIAP